MRFTTDTGGTFTDLIVEDDDGALHLFKSATTPDDPIRGVIDVRRHYFGTSDEYSTLILRVCRALGIDGEQATRIHYASILRDVGMTLLPEGVYKKPVRLSERDRQLVEGHPEQGAKVLRSIEFLPDVLDIILAHHEEPDGSGYPRGLEGSGIPTGAKILAVVDAYNALRSGRPCLQPARK